MRLLQAATIGLILLTIAPGYFFYFDVTPKVVVLVIGVAVLLVAGLVAGGVRETSKSTSILILVNLASLVVSAVFSTHAGLSLIGTNWREFGLIPHAAALILAWFVAGSGGDLRVLLRGVAISSALAGAYGIAQYFGWDPFLPAAAYHVGEGIWTIVRPPGTLGYVSYFATWLVAAAFLCLALDAVETAAGWRWVARGSAAICAVAMLLTGTRAAMLGLAAGGAVWLYLRGWRVTRRMAAGVCAALVLAAAFYFSPAGLGLRSRARWFAEDSAGGGRMLLWRDTLRMAAHRPAAGFGLETYTAEFARFESAELAAAYPDFEWESSHNMFLDALAAQGVLGLAALAALCGWALVAAFRGGTAESAGLAAALTGGLASQQFTGMTVPTAVMIYVTCGLCLKLRGHRVGWRSSSVMAARAIGAIAAAGFIYCAVRLTVADVSLERAQQALRSGDSSTAAAEYGRYERWRMPGAAADIWYSDASLQLAQTAKQPVVRMQALVQARAAAVRAPVTAGNPFDAWYNLAEFDAMNNDSAAMERDLRAAIAARPNWFKPHWALARLLAMGGRREEAAREGRLAVMLDGGKDAEVAQSLTGLGLSLR